MADDVAIVVQDDDIFITPSSPQGHDSRTGSTVGMGTPLTKTRSSSLTLGVGNGAGQGGNALRARLAFAFAGEEFMDKTVARKDKILVLVAFLGLLLLVAQLWIGWSWRENRYSNNIGTELCKLGISLSTAVLLWHIYKYHRFQMVMQVVKQKRVGRLVWRKKQVRSCVIEMCICILHVPPFLPVIPDLLGLLMVLRFYLVIRILRDQSPTYRQRFNIRKNAPSKIGFPTFNSLFAMKSLFDQSAMTLVLVTTAFTALMAAFLFHVLEREKQPRTFGNLFNSLYFAVITMTSVGYGDLQVETVPGRIVAMITGFVGIILASMIVAVVTKILTLKQHQRFAVDWVKQMKYEKNTHHSCATLIQHVWRHYHSVQTQSVVENQRYYRELQVLVSRCKRNRKKLALIRIKSSAYYQKEHLLRLEKRIGELERHQQRAEDSLYRVEQNQREMMSLLRGALSGSRGGAGLPPPPPLSSANKRDSIRRTTSSNNGRPLPHLYTSPPPHHHHHHHHRTNSHNDVTADMYRGNYGANSMYGNLSDSDSQPENHTRSSYPVDEYNRDHDVHGQGDRYSPYSPQPYERHRTREGDAEADVAPDDGEELSSFGFGTWHMGSGVGRKTPLHNVWDTTTDDTGD